MKKIFFPISLVALILTVFLGSYKLYALISPKHKNKCTKCHTEVTHGDYSKKNIHQPLFDKSCVVCHMERIAQKRLLESKQELKLPKGVKLVARNPLPDANLWFQVPYDNVGSEIFMRIRPEYGRRVTKKIELLPIEHLRHLENDGVPPGISDIKIAVQKGLFLTAHITWETNKPTRSGVSYGTENQLTDAPTEDNFSYTHTVELAPLKKNTLYQFKINSTDIFGNKESSDVLTFSTENPRSGIRNTRTATKTKEGEIDLTEKIYRRGNTLVFNLRSNQPVLVTMYSDRKKKYFKSETERIKEEEDKLKKEHAGFRSQLDLTNSICIACHRKKVKLALTHPVNVFPKAGMTIPPEYPTLPDGRITCSSCHNRHASDIEQRRIKSGRKDLCTGCHKDMG